MTIPFLEKPLERLANRLSINLKRRTRLLILRLRAYLRRLVFPLYLFPLKLVVYTLYYLIKFILKFIVAFLQLILDIIIFPFRSLKHFIKSIFILIFLIYIAISGLMTADYIIVRGPNLARLLCGWNMKSDLTQKVVRIVGTYSEGSGFFISPTEVLTNHHVIEGEVSPKVILPNGRFLTPIAMKGTQEQDLAVLTLDEGFPDLVLELRERISVLKDEVLYSAGYPMGTTLTGDASITEGRVIDFRFREDTWNYYIQSDITVVEGMSGGPLVNRCGEVVGVNAMGLGGLSFFIRADYAHMLIPDMTEDDITKLEVDPSISPEEGVRAYYSYLSSRRMEDSFNLLSSELKSETTFEEWTSRFTDVIAVEVFSVRPFEDEEREMIEVERVVEDEIAGEREDETEVDSGAEPQPLLKLKPGEPGQLYTTFVKFGTQNWVNGSRVPRLYEGTWTSTLQDGAFRLVESEIREITNPDWMWYQE